MSVAATRAWINEHKRKDDAVDRWDRALADTQACANQARTMSGFAAATAYYNCRKGKKLPA